MSEHDPSIEELRALAAVDSGDPEVHLRLGVALYELRDLVQAERALQLAAQLDPIDPRPMVWLARLYMLQRRDGEAVAAVEAAMRRKPGHPEGVFVFGLLGVHLGNMEAPQQALQLLRQGRAPTRLVQALEQQYSRIRQVSPSPDPVASTDKEGPLPPRAWGPDEIAIMCGRTTRPWAPPSLDEGIGGSEEAVIRLSRCLHALGWRVTVYCAREGGQSLYDGVTYLPFSRFNPEDEFNILIGWRNVRLFERAFMAKRTYLWLHDLPHPHSYTPQRLDHIDQIMVLSAFHRNCLPDLPTEKFWITANGLDPQAISHVEAEGLRRNPYRCLYASCYSRGLEVLLSVWGAVKAQVPPAELHVYYGWESFMGNTEPAHLAWRSRMEAMMDQPGVFHHGRVSQDDVLRATFQSGIWSYPTTFGETSCITAMKAQAAGAIPVIFDYGALSETVQRGIKVSSNPDGTCTREQVEAYRQQLIKALTHHEWQASIRPEMMTWARQHFAWETVARQWHAVFQAVVQPPMT